MDPAASLTRARHGLPAINPFSPAAWWALPSCPRSLSVAAECVVHPVSHESAILLCLSHCCSLYPSHPCLRLPPAALHLAPAALWTGLAAPPPGGLLSHKALTGLGKRRVHWAQPLVPTCSLVCALVLRSGATAATQRDLVHPRAAENISGKEHGARLHSLGARTLVATCSPREETKAQAQHRVRGPMPACDFCQEASGHGQGLVLSHLEPLTCVSITVEEIVPGHGSQCSCPS